MRMEMLQTVSRFADVSETVLLYGDSNLSDTNNELVFKAVHRYIHQTKRFFIWKLIPSVDITRTIAHCALN